MLALPLAALLSSLGSCLSCWVPVGQHYGQSTRLSRPLAPSRAERGSTSVIPEGERRGRQGTSSLCLPEALGSSEVACVHGPSSCPRGPFHLGPAKLCR